MGIVKLYLIVHTAQYRYVSTTYASGSCVSHLRGIGRGAT
jgi:hypothetical protein